MTTGVSRRLDSFERDIQVAIRTVRDAMRLARSLEGCALASTKSDKSPVTIADLAIKPSSLSGSLRHFHTIP